MLFIRNVIIFTAYYFTLGSVFMSVLQPNATSAAGRTGLKRLSGCCLFRRRISENDSRHLAKYLPICIENVSRGIRICVCRDIGLRLEVSENTSRDISETCLEVSENMSPDLGQCCRTLRVTVAVPATRRVLGCGGKVCLRRSDTRSMPPLVLLRAHAPSIIDVFVKVTRFLSCFFFAAVPIMDGLRF